MAEKLTKKLDREAKELNKLEANLRGDRSNVLHPDSDSSSSSAPSDIESSIHFTGKWLKLRIKSSNVILI